jgi:hypothetical protein
MVHQEHDPNPNRTLIPSASILLQSAFNGDSWTAADAEIVIWDLNFELLPALASYNDMLRMVYVYSGDHTLWYSYFDPNYTRPTYELYVSTPSAFTDEHGVQTVSAGGGVASSGTDPVAENATLRLRREIESADDETLAEVSHSGVNNANLNVEYRCPGGADSSGGTWTIFAEVLFGLDFRSFRRCGALIQQARAVPRGGQRVRQAENPSTRALWTSHRSGSGCMVPSLIRKGSYARGISWPRSTSGHRGPS